MLEIKVKNPGAELESIKFNGEEMLHDGKSFWNRQAHILFPMVGRLHNNQTIINNQKYTIPQHGFAKDMDFEKVEESKDKQVYLLTSTKKTLEMFPFKFELYITYKITDDVLTVEYKVINKDNKNMLFGIGGHPGFKINPNKRYYFELEKEEKQIEFMEVEGEFISNKPAKNLLKNNKVIMIDENSFKNDAIMIKKFKSKTITLFEQFEESEEKGKKVLEFNFEGFPILGIWSIPRAPYICLEPWFNTADKVIETGYFKDKEGIINLDFQKEFECKYKVTFFKSEN